MSYHKKNQNFPVTFSKTTVIFIFLKFEEFSGINVNICEYKYPFNYINILYRIYSIDNVSHNIFIH